MPGTKQVRDSVLQAIGNTPVVRLQKVVSQSMGEVLVKPRGEEKFGWDPWFQPRGSNKTFAEMTPEEKDQVSHRGRAYRQLAEHLKAENARSAGRR